MTNNNRNSCTDCTHYIVCEMTDRQMWLHEEACKDFVKEGSRFTLDELKGWLREVAENNYGNSLEYGCNELIRRIDEGGFERYVKDTRGELG